MKLNKDISIWVYKTTFGLQQTGHVFAPIIVEYDEYDTLSHRILRLSRLVAGRNHALWGRESEKKSYPPI